ncbi:MAG: hypothetical protein H6867_02150 [Rhodospirillales bacterium]|nr:hypothetical protein [Rhodospirillales bacterium]MCB9996990.1 hypothetical protein [Rhodospirillales bacterium]
MKFFTILSVLLLLAAAPALATEDDGGFGAPFANTQHPGFGDPSSLMVADDADATAESLSEIAPAAGDEEDTKENRSTAEAIKKALETLRSDATDL